MDESIKRNHLTRMTDEQNEQTVEFYLSFAKDIILSRLYPFRTDVTEMPKKYDSLQVEIAAYLLNKRGAEGEISHSENGISRTYESAEVPESMLKRIVPFVGTFGGTSNEVS
ncbi:MAG: phage head-tail connector protein [Faecalibacterium sp.]|nr:phage head-tail connector protein [Ruminococcus sp.]MCM1391870.1 phage head-tail connector protein [Ruminococcus sp.]MCM1485554.1 phage head-tail connector protein [Faecalibacterium sp.]